MKFFSIILTIWLFPILTHASVPFVLNPDCNLAECVEPDYPALYYANRIIDDEKIHIVYSTFDELTISILQTGKTVAPVFNYSSLFSHNYTGAIQFPNTKPTNLLSIVLRRLILFNDSSDNATLNPYDNTTISYFLRNIPTQNVTLRNNQTEQPSFELPLESINGSLSIDVLYPGETKRESKFPKLQTTSKSYYLNLALKANNYTVRCPRFAFEIYINSPTNDGSKLFSSRNIDDQFTPGIFNVWQMNTLGPVYHASMLWKPVVYQSEDRSIEQTTLMRVYTIKNNITLDPEIDQGTYYSFLPYPFVSGFNVSLGQAKDEFFAKTNYSFIQFTVGLEYIQADSTVKFVSIALIVTLALPGIVAIIALIFMVKRRCSSPSSSAYSAIDD